MHVEGVQDACVRLAGRIYRKLLWKGEEWNPPSIQLDVAMVIYITYFRRSRNAAYSAQNTTTARLIGQLNSIPSIENEVRIVLFLNLL